MGKNPQWKQEFFIKIRDTAAEVTLQVWDADALKDRVIGETKFIIKQNW